MFSGNPHAKDVFNMDYIRRRPESERALLLCYVLCKAGVVRFDMNIPLHRYLLGELTVWINDINQDYIAENHHLFNERLMLACILKNIAEFIIPIRKNK